MNKTIFIILLLLGILICDSALAWDNNVTHPAISTYAADQSTLGIDHGDYLKNIGIDNGLMQKLVWDNTLKTIKDWIAEGSKREDGNQRELNHFHNPLQPWSSAGLRILGIIPLFGESTVLWSQDSNRQAIWSAPSGPGDQICAPYCLNDGTTPTDWSWKTTKNYFYTALTATANSDKDSNFAKMFFGLGHQIHLLQDMSVPMHVRNNQHLISRMIEGWVKNNKETAMSGFATSIAKPSVTLVDPVNDKAPVARLFDTGEYYKNPTSIGIENTSYGLAEWTNANFFSDDTINLPGYSMSTQFPYPNKDNTDLQSWLAGGYIPKTINAEDGKADTVFYVSKINTGGVEEISHFATFGYTTNEIERTGGNADVLNMSFHLDDKCYQDYAQWLLPRAISYSAALIDYFFRGELTISFPDHCVYGLIDGAKEQTFKTLRAKVRNTTPNEELGPGTLVAVAKYKKRKVYQPNLSADPPKTADSRDSEFSYSVSEPITLTQADIDGLNRKGTAPWYEFTFDFSKEANSTSTPAGIPAGVTDLYLHIIFKGKLGNETDNAVAVGMKDLGEPMHHVYMNSTDQFYVNGAFTTADQMKTYNPALYNLIKASGISVDPYTVQAAIAFCPTSPEVDVYYNSMAPGAYGRIITIMEANVTEYPLAVYWEGSDPRVLWSPNITNQDVNSDFKWAEVTNIRGVYTHALDTLMQSYPKALVIDPKLIPGAVSTSPIEATNIRLQ